MNIAIVDDNKSFVEAMKVVLDMVHNINIVYTASNGLEFVDHPDFKHVDLAIIDIQMPVMDGINAIKVAKLRRPEMVIVTVSNINEKLASKKAYEAGANAFLDKDKISRAVLTKVIEKYRYSNKN